MDKPRFRRGLPLSSMQHEITGKPEDGLIRGTQSVSRFIIAKRGISTLYFRRNLYNDIGFYKGADA